jgi:chromosome partitioning protein
VGLARENLNPELQVLGIVLNIANMRTRHARETLDTLRRHFPDATCETVIRRSIAYAESAERAVPILDYRPDRGVDYVRLAAEIFDRLDMRERRTQVEELASELAPRELLGKPPAEAQSQPAAGW